MSYILDALKKAAEQRSGPPPEVRRLLAPAPVPPVPRSRYVTLGVAATGTIAAIASLWIWSPVHEAPAPDAKPIASAVAAPAASATPPVPIAEERPRVAPATKSRAAVAAPDSSDGRRSAHESSRAATEARPPAAKPRVADATPPEAKLAETTSPETQVTDTRPPQTRLPETRQPETKVLESRPPEPPAPMTRRFGRTVPGVVSPAPAPPVVTVLPPSSAPTAAAGPTPRAGLPPSSQTGAAPMTAAATTPRADSGKLKVEVIVYAEQRPQRWVFINGRKYVEGDAIGDARIEEIQSTGVVLVEDGRRITLRP